MALIESFGILDPSRAGYLPGDIAGQTGICKIDSLRRQYLECLFWVEQNEQDRESLSSPGRFI